MARILAAFFPIATIVLGCNSSMSGYAKNSAALRETLPPKADSEAVRHGKQFE